MSTIGEVWHYAWSFLVVLTVVVFFHELGHYLVARWNGVRVQVFSIGFGPELFGWNDRHGTRWKVSLLPLGGYVKMFGEMHLGTTVHAAEAMLAPEERKVAFFTKHWLRRTAIVAAGPLGNFLLAIVLLAILYATVGQQVTRPEISEVLPGTAAERAGLQPGDVVLRVGDQAIERFEDMAEIVMDSAGTALAFVIRRGEEERSLSITPEVFEQEDNLGVMHRIGRIGVRGAAFDLVKHDPASALLLGVKRTGYFAVETLRAVGQMIAGTRTVEELSGPVGIAQISAQVAEEGVPALVYLIAVLSINLGLINLFPVPLLDGGHLFLYIVEAVRGRPLGPRVLEVMFRIGFGLIVLLIGFVIWNDLKKLGVFDFLQGIF